MSNAQHNTAKQQHTPGPWTRDQYGYIGAMTPGDAFGMPAQVSREICNMQKNPNINADARLIAAAPEMLQALRVINARLNALMDDKAFENAVGHGHWDELCALLDTSAAAVAKATGGAA